MIRPGRKLKKEMIGKQQMASSLRDTEAMYRSLVDSTDDSIYVVGRDVRYLFMNKKHMMRMGLVEGQFLGHQYSEFHSDEETGEFVKNITRVFDTGVSLQNEHQSKRDDKYFLQTLSPVKDKQGNVVAITVISKDITDRKRMEEELRSITLTDELTGLYNRRGFLTLAEQYLKIANRMKNTISILYADIDNMKSINDTFGHQEGDRALIETAGVLKETFRESDVVARIGGDEFVVMPAVMNAMSHDAVMGRLHGSIERLNALQGRKYRLSVSAGIAFYDPENPCSIEELLSRGDRIMYENKRRKNHRL